MRFLLNTLRRGASLLGCLVVLLSPAVAAELDLRRGVNIEAWQNWISKGGFLDPGYDRTNFPDWTAHVDDRRLVNLRAEGFDFVRLNVDPSPLFWVDKDRVGQLTGRVVAAIRRLQAAGFTVIVDLHLLPEMEDRPDGLHAVLGTGGREQVLFDRYLHLVSEFAGRLAELPSDRTALELVNEPDQDWFSHLSVNDRWPAQLAALVTAARQAAPELTLVLSGARSSSIDGLLRLDPARFSGDQRIIWTFHYYEPMAITHAGQPWEETPARFLTHLPYPAATLDAAESKKLLAAARRKIDEVIRDSGRRKALAGAVGKALQDYQASGASPATIAADFMRVKAWASANGIPASRVLLGEFGVFQDQAEPASRLAILQATREAAEAAGFPWAVYTAGLSQPRRSFSVIGDSARFGLEPAVKEALGLGSK
jgi:endoglucanase